MVAKMSYNNHTEVNVVYETKGDVRVRMAMHPYKSDIWTKWYKLDSMSCYFLDETEPMAEQGVDNHGRNVVYRNKHEIIIENGAFFTFCMFDPGLTGVETYSSGTYAAYEKLSDVVDSDRYRNFLDNVYKIDAVTDAESLARAQEEAKRHLHESSLV